MMMMIVMYDKNALSFGRRIQEWIQPKTTQQTVLTAADGQQFLQRTKWNAKTCHGGSQNRLSTNHSTRKRAKLMETNEAECERRIPPRLAVENGAATPDSETLPQ